MYIFIQLVHNTALSVYEFNKRDTKSWVSLRESGECICELWTKLGKLFPPVSSTYANVSYVTMLLILSFNFCWQKW